MRTQFFIPRAAFPPTLALVGSFVLTWCLAADSVPSSLGTSWIETARKKAGVLADASAPVQERCDAALFLGESRYFEAISVLIESIDLFDENPSTTEGSIDALYPCVHALLRMGGAEMVPVVKAWIDEGDDERRQELLVCVAAARDPSGARAYARGLLAASQEPEQRKRLTELVNILGTYKKRER